MQHLFAPVALLTNGWEKNIRLNIDDNGYIQSITKNAVPQQSDNILQDKILLPAPANLHSHGFQRALAGLSEARGISGQDSFWTWRRIMYSFLDNLTPEDTQNINAFAQMEMLEAGYASVAEFHYTHHQAGGIPYDDLAEQGNRVIAAANQSGIGLTMLPVYYAQGGVDGRPLEGGQLRFKCNIDQYGKLHQDIKQSMAMLSGDSNIGIAPHSLRSVSNPDLDSLVQEFGDGIIHIHIAEQQAELDQIEAAYLKRPVDWLLSNFEVKENWCLIHATHLSADEKAMLAKSKAVVGICPITEANLGDGIFDAKGFFELNGKIGIGTDSNISISLINELKSLEYSQRLCYQARSIICNQGQSTGRSLFDMVCRNGAKALGRESGGLKAGLYADMISLDASSLDLVGLTGDTILDAWIFASTDQLLMDTWSAGRHIVKDGRHINRDAIINGYKKTISKFRKIL